MGEASTDALIDARGLLCPMPVIRLQQGLAGAPAGTCVELRCDDPGAAHDIPAWCRIHGHTLVSCQKAQGELVFHVCVGVL